MNLKGFLQQLFCSSCASVLVPLAWWLCSVAVTTSHVVPSPVINSTKRLHVSLTETAEEFDGGRLPLTRQGRIVGGINRPLLPIVNDGNHEKFQIFSPAAASSGPCACGSSPDDYEDYMESVCATHCIESMSQGLQLWGVCATVVGGSTLNCDCFYVEEIPGMGITRPC